MSPDFAMSVCVPLDCCQKKFWSCASVCHFSFVAGQLVCRPRRLT